MKPYVAFFDLDNTILNINSGRAFVEQAYSAGMLSKRDIARAWYLAAIYKLGLADPEKIIARMARWLKGVPEQQIIDLSGRVFQSSLQKAIRSRARQEIQAHKEKQATTVILSAAINHICTLVQKSIGLDDAVCTELEVVGGRFTGRPKGRYCYGVEKVQRLRDYCSLAGCAPQEAWYYADSLSDLPALEIVGNPVCVTPDERLRKVARQRGWTICDW